MRPYTQRLWLLVTLALCASLPLWVLSEGSPPRVIRGRVTAEAGKPVEGAIIRIKGTPLHTFTAPDGTFTLEIPADFTPPLRVTATKAGYFITGAQWNGSGPLNFQLRSTPSGMDPQYRWVDPGPNRTDPNACANCHVEIYAEWASSTHATSAINPVFLDVFYGRTTREDQPAKWHLLRDRPDGRGVCAPCHVPQATFGSPALEDPRVARGTEREGVHCDICHKIRDVAVTVFGLTHGMHAYEVVLPSPAAQVFFGPLDDVDRASDAYAPIFRDARFCAPCHEGTVLGTHAYSTFSEWAKSEYAVRGQTCQSCHMAPDGKKRNIAPGHGGIDRDPLTLATHNFQGRSLEMLKKALSMELDVKHTDGNSLLVNVEIRVTNAGHRVPTGFPQRHLVLAVLARNAAGNLLTLTDGPVLPPFTGHSKNLGRQVAGLPGVFYGRIFADAHGNAPVAYWAATSTLIDSRLAPDSKTHQTFRFSADGPGPYEIQAYLLYRAYLPELEIEKGRDQFELLVASTRSNVGTRGNSEKAERTRAGATP